MHNPNPKFEKEKKRGGGGGGQEKKREKKKESVELEVPVTSFTPTKLWQITDQIGMTTAGAA